ncbi:hypothetical protein EVAR_89701_1 [Eumeta japonica]|uniref:Uncharacterized protein n=1 Tax=Eumeta variegata TaxID=151549 RepID=A0A4C1X0P6_EUMVA|nr:hypothetical protein EVAR_89701_1 [Eumeta japonica]
MDLTIKLFALIQSASELPTAVVVDAMDYLQLKCHLQLFALNEGCELAVVADEVTAEANGHLRATDSMLANVTVTPVPAIKAAGNARAFDNSSEIADVHGWL